MLDVDQHVARPMLDMMRKMRGEGMTRTRQLWLALATWLTTTLAMAWWMWPHEAPPTPRVISPEAILNIKEEERLRNERWEAEDAISRLTPFPIPDVSDSFQRDVLAIIEQLRKELLANNAKGIAAYNADLRSRAALLHGAGQMIDRATAFLAAFDGELSPPLRRQVAEEAEVVRQALHGRDWDRLRASHDALSWLFDHRLMPVTAAYSEIKSVDGLGPNVNPKLRQQIEAAIDPVRQALKGDSWDRVAEQYQRLPMLHTYPSHILSMVQDGRATAEALQASEKAALVSALDGVDAALQGESWDELVARAQDVSTARHEVVTRLGHNGQVAPPCVRILTIDGGGIRGIIPAIILSKLESRANAPVAKLFDYVVGTSTGGILALGLAAPDPDNPGKPLHAATELVALYKKEGAKIFPDTSLKSISGLFGPKYRAEGIERILKGYFGEVMLKDALLNVVVPAYAIDSQDRSEGARLYRHVFFDNFRDIGAFIYMWEAARAASAAPTYFPPFEVPAPPPIGRVALIDGGVFANNPAVYALSIVKRREYALYGPRAKPYDAAHPILMLSLGTGRAPQSIAFRDAWGWGGLHWLGPILDITLSDPGIEDEAQQLLGYFDLYYRMQPTLTAATAALDNADEKNIAALEEAADRYVKDNSIMFDKLVAQLNRQRPADCRPRIGPFE